MRWNGELNEVNQNVKCANYLPLKLEAWNKENSSSLGRLDMARFLRHPSTTFHPLERGGLEIFFSVRSLMYR